MSDILISGGPLKIENIWASLKCVTFTIPIAITKKGLSRLTSKLKRLNINFELTETYTQNEFIHGHSALLKLNSRKLSFIIYKD